MNENHGQDQLLSVSIIVPVRNGAKTIGLLLDALLKQDYPEDKTQIIIVDNDSLDHTASIVKKYPVILEQENGKVGSYAARNKGLSVASGEIIAFTDADCIPESGWVRGGVQALSTQNADAAGGRIKFVFSGRKTASACFDSLNNLRNDRFIDRKIGAITANLFVRAVLFRRLGGFQEVMSGGDINWTGKALSAGYSLVYVPEAVVSHPARNLTEMLRKSWFRGTGMLLTLRQGRWWFFRSLFLISRLLIPVPSAMVVKSLTGVNSDPDIKGRRLSIWGISYLNQLASLGGIAYSLCQKISYRCRPAEKKQV
ncbi:MAG: glycosyltransferase [Smithella sp.]|nr:glycosyltransferase [Smithella sp.]